MTKVYIDGMMVAAETPRQGVTVGEGTESGLMFADDFVGISETPGRLPKQIAKALDYTRKKESDSERKKVHDRCM